jgi:hypothetical protein
MQPNSKAVGPMKPLQGPTPIAAKNNPVSEIKALLSIRTSRGRTQRGGLVREPTPLCRQRFSPLNKKLGVGKLNLELPLCPILYKMSTDEGCDDELTSIHQKERIG